jgi:hypothetical protein
MLKIITGESKISLRIVDWFATNYAKKYFTLYDIPSKSPDISFKRFKVYTDYKLKLKAYSKKRFDPFCRWERISIPYPCSEYIESNQNINDDNTYTNDLNIIKQKLKKYEILNFF